jgi:predicted nucleotidyltransferase
MRYFDASTRRDLDHVAYAVGGLQPNAAAHGIDLLVVGAAARDILLSTKPLRATNDVDVAVAVESFAQVPLVTEGFEPVAGHHRRFRVRGVEVDVVPFGDVEAPDRTVTSPEGYRLNLLGMSEALACAVTVTLPLGVVAQVASLPAQAALKVVAWNDRHHVNARDAEDLRSLLTEYASGVHSETMYGEHFERIERFDYDLTLAAAERMGAEAADVLGERTADLVQTIERECSDAGVLPAQMGTDVARNRALLVALLAGLRERR